MREMMARIGQTPGLLTKLPGFGQMGNIAKMKGMDVGSFFDELEAMEAPESAAGGAFQPRRTFDRDKRKKKQKLDKASKKANRKKK